MKKAKHCWMSLLGQQNKEKEDRRLSGKSMSNSLWALIFPIVFLYVIILKIGDNYIEESLTALCNKDIINL